MGHDNELYGIIDNTIYGWTSPFNYGAGIRLRIDEGTKSPAPNVTVTRNKIYSGTAKNENYRVGILYSYPDSTFETYYPTGIDWGLGNTYSNWHGPYDWYGLAVEWPDQEKLYESPAFRPR